MPSRPLPYPVIYVGAETGAPPAVKAYDAETGKLNFERTAYESTFTGGVRVATADFTGDGFPDLAVAPGEGGGPRVRILDGKSGQQIDGPLGNFFAFDPSFKGGVEVAAGDVTGDNVPDLIVAAGKTGGPHIRVFDGQSGAAIMNFMAFDPDFRGGVSIAAADFTLDGKAEVVVGAGYGGGPHVKTFDVATGQTIPGRLGNFFAYEPEFRGGVRVGTDWKTGDFGGDGRADLAVGPGPGRSPDVKLYSGATGQLLRQFTAFDATMTAGVRVALAYVSDDAMADVVVATGVGVPNQVRVFDTKTNALMTDQPGVYTPFGPTNANGLTLAASNDPPNQYGYFDLPVYEMFEYIPQEAELIYNNYRVFEDVHVVDDRLRWELTVTNISMDFNDTEWPHDMFDDGLGVFQIPTHTTSDVFVVDNKNGWSGSVTSTNGEEGYIRFQGTPIFVNESVQLTFTTPLLSPVLDWSTAAATLLPPPAYEWPLQSTTILQMAVPGERVKVEIRHGETNQVATNLYVAKWEEAYMPNTPTNPTHSVLKDPVSGIDIFDLDIDRFNIWVKDIASWDHNVNVIYTELSTENLAGYETYNDLPTTIGLVRHQTQPGWYWSDSLILVSNQIDDKHALSYSLNDDDPAQATPVNTKHGYNFPRNDRMHTVSLGGKVKATYLGAKDFEVTVPIENEVSINAKILKKNATTLVASVNAVVDYIKKENEYLAQIGVKLIIVGEPLQLTPTDPNVDPSNGIFFNSTPPAVPEMYSLFQDNASNRTGTPSDVEFYIIDYLINSPGKFETLPDALALTLAEFGNGLGNTILLQWNSIQTYQDHFYTPPETIQKPLPGALTHEIMHLLINSANSDPDFDHYTAPQFRYMLMYKTGINTKVNQRIRITYDEELQTYYGNSQL